MPYVPLEQAIQQNPDYVKQNYPNVYSQYLQQVQQPTAQLGQTQTSTAATAAEIPGIQASSQTRQIQAQQAGALQNLGKDLSNKMTLGSALKKYTALGMSPDEVFKQYLAESPWGMPNETPQKLQEMGISANALGQIGTPGSFMDRYNTKNAIEGLQQLEKLWHQTSGLSKLPFLGDATPSGQAYDAARTIFGNHLATLIPGASGAASTGTSLLNTLPGVGDLTQLEPGAASGRFNAVQDQLLKTKGYNLSDLGLAAPKKANTGNDLLKNLLDMALPTTGSIAGGALGGLAGAAIPGADLTGAPEVAGAIGGAGIGGGAGQALADLLTGKKPGADVAITGGLSAAGEGFGGALGTLLGKVGGKLASKVPDNVFNKVVSASPSYVSNIADLKNTATKYGLMEGNTATSLQQMPKIMEDLGNTIQAKLANIKQPVPLSTVEENILNKFKDNTNAFENTADFENAKKYITKRLFQGTGNQNPISEILGSSGQPMQKTAANTSYLDLYNLKSQIANDLKPVFKAEATPGSTRTLSTKDEANLALWNGLKNEIDKVDPQIRTLNNDQHNMFDIAKAFVKDANSNKSGSSLTGDIFDTLTGSMLGGVPGALAGIMGGRFIKSEAGRQILSKILQSGALQGGLKTGGSALGGILGGVQNL